MAKESDEQIACMHLFALAKCKVWRNNVGAMKVPDKNRGHRYVRFGQKGHPDIIGYKEGDGSFVCWEVKRKGGRVRPEQKQFVQDTEGSNVFSGIGTSNDLEMKLREYGWI